MNQNVYAAPSAVLADVDEGNPAVDAMFYIVSRRKFLVLYYTTFGLYMIFWLYAHWQAYKEKTGESIIPILRAIFGIFFIHSLFSKINGRKAEMGDQASWAHGWHATAVVTLVLLSQVMDRLSTKSIGSSITDILPLIILLPKGLLFLKAQEYANIACGDPNGHTNSRFSGANYCWIVLGAIFWVLVAVGIFAIVADL